MNELQKVTKRRKELYKIIMKNYDKIQKIERENNKLHSELDIIYEKENKLVTGKLK